MPRNKRQVLIYISISVLFFTLLFSNVTEIKGQTQQTLEDNEAVVTNINDCYVTDHIMITWTVISGSGIDVYLRNQSTLLLFGAPSSGVIQQEINSMAGSINHTVEYNGDYSIIFINDEGSTITFEYTQVYTPVYMTNLMILAMNIISIVIPVVLAIVGVITLGVILNKRRNKPKYQEVIRKLDEEEFRKQENSDQLS